MGSRLPRGATDRSSSEMQQSQEDSPESSQRRDRAAIAAQACQTCRNRKSKCDEQRPKCGLCRRLNVECQYREPQPTKKDKTLVHILESLQRLENKFDTLSVSYSSTPSSQPSQSHDRSQSASHTGPQSAIDPKQPQESEDAQDLPTADDLFPKELQRSYRHLTAAHKIILWPAIYLQIINSSSIAAEDLQYVLQGGTPWFIRLELDKHPTTLPCPPDIHGLLTTSVRQNPRLGFAGLTVDNIQRLTDAYFNTFNIIHPLLNRDAFVTDIVGPMIRNGYTDGDAQACLALLVFALGQVAIDGVFGAPISNNDGTPSGIRGGTATEPPGLDLYNEARRRIGFIMHQYSLENVQIYLLQATYCESCARHMDFWRSCMDASTSCQALIRCEQVDWSTPRADLIKRAYWICILNEDLYHLELDLPQTGIHTLEDHVPLPYFDDIRSTASGASDERSHFQYHFLAMIALRRLITRIHGSLHGGSARPAEFSEDYGGPPTHVIQELARQLESWRSLLPQPLQWSDQDQLDFPNINPLSRRPADGLFEMDQGPVPINHRFNLDIITGQLRTRFYYAKFMIYRPFVYKALHFPELMSMDDANCCATAIRAACMWPLSLAPPKNKKRLVPHLFTWTQNFVGILLVLRMTTENDCLRQICQDHIDKQQLERTASLLLDWIRDMRQVDGIAEWSWRMLEPLYSMNSN